MAESESNTDPAPTAEAAKSRASNEASTAYAIIETGGKQYRVAVGERLAIEKLPVDAGSEITFDRVLMVNDGGAIKVGTPVVSGATVNAQVEEQFRGTKIIVFKYKPKKRYRRRTGHRQSLTRVSITAINA